MEEKRKATVIEEAKTELDPEKSELTDDAMEKVAGGEDYMEYLADVAENTVPIFF